MENKKKKKELDKSTVLYSEKKNDDDVIFSESNNRADKRIKVSIEVTISGPHTFFSGFTMDISKGGLFVATHKLFPIGTELLLNLKIGSQSLELLTSVVWIRDMNSSAISGESPGMGLRFINIDSESVGIISSFLEKKDPILYDTEL